MNSNEIMSNPWDLGGSTIFYVGDYICFKRGKYFGQEGVIESVTDKMARVRIAPHSPDSLKLVRVMPESLRHLDDDEIARIPDWDWESMNKVLDFS